MAARYSNLPYPLSNSPPYLSPKDKDLSNTTWVDYDVNASHKTSFQTWVGAVWALAAHFVLSVGVTLFVLLCVDGHYFNITERTPPVQVVEETQTTSFLLLQSDIVTILSTLIVVLKCVLGVWTGALCWHVTLFLMERHGFTRRDLRVLLSCRILAPSAYSRNWSTWTIGALLLISFAANLASSVLTGSIAWVPANRPVHGLSTRPISVRGFDGKGMSYITDLIEPTLVTTNTINSIGIGWGRNPDRSIFKRVVTDVEVLSTNSTIQNITLPYFGIHSIRWIENRNEIPGLEEVVNPDSMLRAPIKLGPIAVKNFDFGTPVLVPSNPTNWSNNSIVSITSEIVHDTRLLVLKLGREANTSDLPLKAYQEERGGIHYAFAWVEFSAGAGRCREYSCIISSTSTIQNNTPIEVEPHLFTSQALAMAPAIGAYLVKQNTSIPNIWTGINSYIEAVLVRSYSGSWMTLNERLSPGPPEPSTSYIPSLPSLLAHVDRTRVYIWTGLQLLVTLFSILFLIARSKLSKYPLIGDTTLTAFYLDTTEVPGEEDVARSQEMGSLTIEPQGDRFKVKLE